MGDVHRVVFSLAHTNKTQFIRQIMDGEQNNGIVLLFQPNLSGGCFYELLLPDGNFGDR